jgi:outer membrane lipoprotein SlyB
VSILLKQKDTRNISVKEDAIRGAKKGGLAGGILGTLATVLTVPALGPLVVAGPIVSALGGAVVGGAIGALAGGSGALTHIGIPKHLSAELERKLHDGAILIAVHSSDPVRLDRALRVFKSEGAEEIYAAEDLAA